MLEPSKKYSMATSLAQRILPRQLQEVNRSDMGIFSAGKVIALLGMAR